MFEIMSEVPIIFISQNSTAGLSRANGYHIHEEYSEMLAFYIYAVVALEIQSLISSFYSYINFKTMV